MSKFQKPFEIDFDIYILESERIISECKTEKERQNALNMLKEKS